MSNDSSTLVAERRRIGTGTILLSAVLLLLVLFTLAFCGVQYLTGRKVAAELSKIRDASEPTNAAELEAFYALPADVNDTTSLWMAAAQTLATQKCQDDAGGLPWLEAGPLTPVGTPWPHQEAAEQFLQKYHESREKIRQAVTLGGAARYPTRFRDAMGMRLSAQRDLRFVGSLLSLEYEVELHRGEGLAACEAVHSMFSLARSLEYEPLMLSQLMRLAHDNMAFGHFERLMMSVEVPTDGLLQIDEDLARVHYDQVLRRALLGERAMGLETFRQPQSLGSEAPSAAMTAIFGQGDQAVYLQLMGNLVKASAAGPVSLDREARMLSATFQQTPALWRFPVAKLMYPSMEAFAGAVAGAMARRDVTHTAIAVERYRRSQGRWPASLDDLVPGFISQVPADPFAAGPLRFVVGTDGCRVYSIGPDNVDQGGLVEEVNPPNDIVFRLPNREGPVTQDE
ncbi:MAG TPA: hypothetical protein VHC22_06410 [Pirellulales bacterium]|nr:hypothetical protein [Pirellulales bacterium]